MQVKLLLLKGDLTMTMVMMVENRRKKHTKKIKGFKPTVKKRVGHVGVDLQVFSFFFPDPVFCPAFFLPLYSFSALERTNSFFSPNNVCRSFCPNNGQSVLRRSSSRCSVKLWSVLISSQPLRLPSDPDELDRDVDPHTKSHLEEFQMTWSQTL